MEQEQRRLSDEEIAQLEKDVKAYKIVTKTLMREILVHPIKVTFDPPETMILWSDRTKTKVTCLPEDTYDKEKGFLLAFCKKHCSNKSWYIDMVRRFVDGTGIEELDIVKENLGDETDNSNYSTSSIPGSISHRNSS